MPLSTHINHTAFTFNQLIYFYFLTRIDTSSTMSLFIYLTVSNFLSLFTSLLFIFQTYQTAILSIEISDFLIVLTSFFLWIKVI